MTVQDFALHSITQAVWNPTEEVVTSIPKDS